MPDKVQKAKPALAKSIRRAIKARMGTSVEIQDSLDLPLGQQLCTACGMCCTGALHDFAQLQPEEGDLAKSLGLKVLEGEEPRFLLPCHLLEGTKCGVYGTRARPTVCGRYRCHLLTEVENSDEPIADALAKVETAHGLLAAIDALGVESLTYSEARAVAAPQAYPAGAARAEAKIGGDNALRSRVRLHATALMLFIERNFRERHKSGALTMSPVIRTESST